MQSPYASTFVSAPLTAHGVEERLLRGRRVVMLLESEGVTHSLLQVSLLPRPVENHLEKFWIERILDVIPCRAARKKPRLNDLNESRSRSGLSNPRESPRRTPAMRCARSATTPSRSAFTAPTAITQWNQASPHQPPRRLLRDRDGHLVVIEAPGKTRVTLLDAETLKNRGHAVIPKYGGYDLSTLTADSDVIALRRFERVDRAYIVGWSDDTRTKLAELRVVDAKVALEATSA